MDKLHLMCEHVHEQSSGAAELITLGESERYWPVHEFKEWGAV
jgi:hypothetical protein